MPLLITILFILIIGLGVLLYFLHRRIEDFSYKMANHITEFTEADRILRDNQDVLQKDLNKIFNDYKKNQK